MGATAVYELDTEHDRDAQAVYQRALDVSNVLNQVCSCRYSNKRYVGLVFMLVVGDVIGR